MNDKFLKPYNHLDTESRIYELWEKSGYFNPDNLPQRHQEPFSIVLPPPNVTGTLHIGHAFEHSIQDIMVRFQRMQGKKTLWLPGTDHAAIATQTKVQKILEKEGIKKHELGREKFLERVDEFAEESHDTIVSQIRRMGASLDWSREAFTLDNARKLSVNTAFKRLYDLGLIYQGSKVINWDPKGQTVISDDEVIHEERDGELYTFRYWADFPIPIATTRPETKLGDTAVAVHPEDERYKEYVGQTYTGNFAGVSLSIKIVADHTIDREFGTGAVGITPMHSQTDAELAQTHDLEGIQVIDEFAKVTVEPFKGLKTTEVRSQIVDLLRESNLLIKEEKIKINISLAERSGGVIEPLPKEQWFIALNKKFVNLAGEETTLKEMMRNAVEKEGVQIIPDNFEKIYFNWIDKLRDWCISRQIWYGHRIPVWYRSTNTHGKSSEVETYVGTEAPSGQDWVQDEDTLDTWFSSGLWPFSTLGWPNETEDLKMYYPNTLMAPGYEILFFWVARMILMSQALLGQIPFHTVYIHGMVRDKSGNKFSKSLGNGVDPVEMADKYGADSLRMALIVGVGPGSDSKFDEAKVGAYRKFSNKLWNISRFVLSTERVGTELNEGLKAEFDTLAQDTTKDMTNYRFDIAADKIYHYLWHRFADEIIEESKHSRTSNDTQPTGVKVEYIPTLYYILENSLKLLHPFMPFITEEIWQELGYSEPLMIEQWPA